MEQIIEIKDYENGKGYSRVAGFEVVTTKQSIKLYMDDEEQCYEKWGYFWCNENPQDFIGATVNNVSVTDTALNEAEMRKNELDPKEKYFEGGVMFVNIDTDKGLLQFVAYNEHNGFYGHEAKVECSQLNHSETL